MRSNFLFGLLILTQLLSAQTFTEVPSFNSFSGVETCSVVFSDVDGDGDEDVLITGRGINAAPVSKLYINDGDGNFIEKMGTPFSEVSFSSVAFSDVDGDGDNDVLITGENASLNRIARLYVNDGLGNFTHKTSTPFDGVILGSVAFSDVDGDGDYDVLITGLNSSGTPISKLYTNDGGGNFTLKTGIPFEGVRSSSIAISDVDGDGDEDVLITGRNYSDDRISKLYTNDGVGNFTEITDAPFEGVVSGAVAFSDVDGDGDNDVLLTGLNSSGAAIAKLYINDGGGHFTEMTGTLFDGVSASAVAFSDVDGDGDNDVLLTGLNSSGAKIAKLYINDGGGHFTEMTNVPFVGVSFGSVAFSDVDGDGDLDLLMSGALNAIEKISKLYVNDGHSHFTKKSPYPFEGVVSGAVAFSDVDGDGDEDVLITGLTRLQERISKLYANDGLGHFTEIKDTPFDGVSSGSVAFSDVDGDGDHDLLITGAKGVWAENPISKLYINDGVGNFTEMTGTPFEGVSSSSVAFSDVDGDGDPDVLITGRNNPGEQISKLYTNDGSGSFTEKTGTLFIGVGPGAIAFSDVDGDGDPDVLITGQDSLGELISKLYANDGLGNFTEKTGTPFDGVLLGSVAFSDVDGDGDQDVLITGLNSSVVRVAKLYINDGGGNFTEMTGTLFDGVSRGSVTFSDVDGDGDQDVLITGTENNDSDERISKLYINNGAASFTDDLPLRFNLVFTPYPNPTVASTFNIEYNSAENGFVNISLYDLQGHLLGQQKEFAVHGKQTFSVDIASLPPGSYFIQLDDGKGKGVAKFVVN